MFTRLIPPSHHHDTVLSAKLTNSLIIHFNEITNYELIFEIYDEQVGN